MTDNRNRVKENRGENGMRHRLFLVMLCLVIPCSVFGQEMLFDDVSNRTPVDTPTGGDANASLKEIMKLSKTGVAALLHDLRIPGNASVGGMADPHFFKNVQNIVNCPVILAGGLKSTNIEQMLKLSQARMIDVMTGVEVAPGIKDEAKVAAFFRNLQMLTV